MYFDLISGALLLHKYTNLSLHPQIQAFYQAHMIIHPSPPTNYYCQTAIVAHMSRHSPRYAKPCTYKQITDLLPSLDDVDLASLKLKSTNPGKDLLDNIKKFQHAPD